MCLAKACDPKFGGILLMSTCNTPFATVVLCGEVSIFRVSAVVAHFSRLDMVRCLDEHLHV